MARLQSLVLDSVSSPITRRVYNLGLDEFFAWYWYGQEPRPGFTKATVSSWRVALEIARSLRQHRELILNYFRAQKLISSGVVEGLNNKAKVTMRKSYGFRTYRVLELALYHSLGKLPEPEATHDFF